MQCWRSFLRWPLITFHGCITFCTFKVVFLLEKMKRVMKEWLLCLNFLRDKQLPQMKDIFLNKTEGKKSEVSEYKTNAKKY